LLGSRRRNLIAVTVVTAIGAVLVFFHYWHFWHSGGLLAWLRAHLVELRGLYQVHPVLMLLGCCLADVFLYTFAIPGAWILTLGAGAVFGVVLGVAVITVGNTLGSLSAFLAGRHLFQGWAEARFGRRLRRIRDGFERHGPLYLLSLRLVPLIPHFVINFSVALTHIRTRDFIWATCLGSLPATWAFVNAGTAAGRVQSVGDIINTRMILSLLMLAVLPLLGLLWARWSSAMGKGAKGRSKSVGSPAP
jgi:uncharacterized membrane protein YdjX (TVP38/TMEM64 family)